MKQPVIREYVPVVLRPILARLNTKYQKDCHKEVLLYAECVKIKALEIQEHECQQTFQDMFKCIRAVSNNNC